MGRAVRWAWDVAIGTCAGGTIIRALETHATDRDFVAFLSGGWMLATGRGHALYDLAAQADAQHALFGPGTFYGAPVLPFNQPPWIAALFAPLALAPVDVAFAIWAIVSLVLVAAIALDLRRRTRALSFDAPPGLVLFALIPIWDSIAQGQVSVLLLATWWLAFAALLDGRDALAGIALSVGGFKPHIAALLAIGFAVDGRWKTIAWTAGSQAALWALAAIPCGLGVVGGYFGMLRLTATTPFDVASTMLTPRGLLSLLGVPRGIGMAVGMIGWVVSLALAAAIWRSRRFDLPSRFALTTLAATVLSPHLFVHDQSLFCVAIGADAIRSARAGSPWTSRDYLAPAWLLLAGLWAIESSWPAVGAPAMLLGTAWFAVVVTRRTLRACSAAADK